MKWGIPKSIGFNTKMVSFWMIWGTPILGNICEEEFAYHSRVLGLFPPDFSEAVFSWIQENRNQICDDLRTSLRFIGLSHGIIDPPKSHAESSQKIILDFPLKLPFLKWGVNPPFPGFAGGYVLFSQWKNPQCRESVVFFGRTEAESTTEADQGDQAPSPILQGVRRAQCGHGTP